MLLRNSLLQMARTKVKTILFLTMLILAVTFLSLAINLWFRCNKNIQEYNKAFMTLGIIDQKETAITTVKTWDAATKEYTYYDEPVYDAFLPISLLDFEGANYIMKPEQRPSYGAYSPGIKIRDSIDEERQIGMLDTFCEFTPYEDCRPTEPVKVKVVKVLRGAIAEVGEDVWLCDHYNSSPGMLEKGKTYITDIFFATYNFHTDMDEEIYFEYFPSNPIYNSGSKDAEGQVKWDEVTDHFYETNIGRMGLEAIKASDMIDTGTIPVLPTNKTKLLMDFHQGITAITNGRDISEEEYQKGDKVCLVPQGLAGRNGLKIGDRIRLQLYFANYKRTASQSFSTSGLSLFSFPLVNSDGKVYPVFEDSNYEIVGIYNGGRAEDPTGYERGPNEVIVPMQSIQNSDENNIVEIGPMKGYTTSFQIPNGTTQEYMEKFKALGIDNLEITFYDGGYEKLLAGMEKLKMVSMVLLVASVITTVAILFFFVFMFVFKQKKRTAIERSLGMKKIDCMKSLLYGMLGIAAVGGFVGSLIGYLLSLIMMSNSANPESGFYSSEFSNWVNNSDKITNTGINEISINPLLSISIFAAVLLISFIIAVIFIKNNLEEEPLALLSQNEK